MQMKRFNQEKYSGPKYELQIYWFALISVILTLVLAWTARGLTDFEANPSYEMKTEYHLIDRQAGDQA